MCYTCHVVISERCFQTEVIKQLLKLHDILEIENFGILSHLSNYTLGIPISFYLQNEGCLEHTFLAFMKIIWLKLDYLFTNSCS
jgi:hypothetical protein